MGRWRVALAVAGLALLLFGVVRLLTGVPFGQLLILLVWMIGAVVLHDGVIAPFTVAVGWAVGRLVPPRFRRYLQAFLITGGLITAIAIPLILRRNTQPASKALLQLNYGGNLTLLLGIVAGASLLLYAAQVTRDRRSSRPER